MRYNSSMKHRPGINTKPINWDVNPNGCWLVTSHRPTGVGSSGGYVAVSMMGGKKLRLHRVIWELEHGRPIEEGKILRHTCDVRHCVNPNHLLEGTNWDNCQDAKSRNRIPLGSSRPFAVLTEAQVWCLRALRARGIPVMRAARSMGVSEKAALASFRPKRWRGVPYPDPGISPSDGLMEWIQVEPISR